MSARRPLYRFRRRWLHCNSPSRGALVAEAILADAPPRPRHCAGCQHVHGGRAFGVCLVSGRPCVAVQAARSIDYLAKLDDSRTLPAREKIELDTAILGGERGAAQLAQDFGIAMRTVVRRRKELRAQGFRIFVPESEQTELGIEARRKSMRRINARRMGGGRS